MDHVDLSRDGEHVARESVRNDWLLPTIVFVAALLGTFSIGMAFTVVAIVLSPKSEVTSTEGNEGVVDAMIGLVVFTVGGVISVVFALIVAALTVMYMQDLRRRGKYRASVPDQ